jgi:hypothetical protein
MREPTYPIIVVALAMLVAPAFAQQGERGLEEQRPLRTPEGQKPLRLPEVKVPLRTPEGQKPLRTQTFHGRDYHGQVAWGDGRWRHEVPDGRNGWWWDVGGFWYFYPEQIEGQPEGPPDYVSDVEVAEDTPASPTTPAPAPADSNYAVYYRPGDLTGTRYKTLEECLQVRKQAGSGECILK